MIAADPECAWILRIVDVNTADIRRTGQLVFRVLAALNVEARYAISQHGSGPHLSAATGHGVIRRAPWRRDFPLRDAFGLGIEHADSVALIFPEP